ncbi:helicase-related protein [Gulosibacter molinativorax]|uniref:Helicase n=1 Tax=Gulosibacter molinativorax TaxID=256821 RepID=A0ABT7C8H2_9MICO|nr:helicase-related protein [Gulosibacter molinativorax]MDJ1371447.1 helicase [Gulosibacter molinativorax]QUY62945.1 Helicase [Gulosibacter molinativorax]
MTSSVDVNAVMRSLKGFQRATVDHVFEQFYGTAGGSGRFLVADETGLGKSIVAKGLIARAIDHLESDDSVDRIDIVYVCSNADLATQNLRRLNVTGDDHLGFASRLTMLAKESQRLSEPSKGPGKKVNLISFTPGTSFSEGGHRAGAAPERALITLLLDGLFNRDESQRRATRILLQGQVSSVDRFGSVHVEGMRRSVVDGLDPVIAGKFADLIRADGTAERFLSLRDAHLEPGATLEGTAWHQAQDLIARMRQALAHAGVETLEPDLVILDEFQRFRHLLNAESGDAAELAHSLFEYGNAKVLLLSATPYKPFTNGNDEDDHYRDFLATVNFLSGGRAEVGEGLQRALESYRHALSRGERGAAEASRVREILLPVMSRSERPRLSEKDDLVRVIRPDVPVPSSGDLVGAVHLRELAEILRSPLSIEYWKSIPYFVNFMENYRIGAKLKEAQESRPEELERALGATQSLDAAGIKAYEPIDFGNGKLRALADRTIGEGMWKLLWLPPSMPYLKPGRVYSTVDVGLTKTVLFSAWTATPTSVASLLSHEADRLTFDGLTAAEEMMARPRSRRLSYTERDGRLEDMSTLQLFWPHPELAKAGDQLVLRAGSGAALERDQLVDAVGARLRTGTELEDAPTAYFAYPGAFPEGVDAGRIGSVTVEEDLSGVASEQERQERARAQRTALEAHVAEAQRIAREHAGAVPAHPDLARLAAFAPGNIAWRALRSVSAQAVTDAELWHAARVVSTALRSMFHRADSSARIVALYPGDHRDYWQLVLEYCADGNLQAVLDEYAFQLQLESGGGTEQLLDSKGVMEVAERIAAAIGMLPATYVAHDNTLERERISMTARFAVRYGGTAGKQSSESVGQRMSSVRHSFNSPFAPFVLASTSAGQEGIDFHWWSHEVVHWDLPSSPVDFEQREGRVNRFAGHAIRKNIAEAHGDAVLDAGSRHPWRDAFAEAERVDNGHGEFSPWWIYPGSSRVNRVLVTYPFSSDAAKYERLRDDLTRYRLTLGQPRQGDMVEMLAKRGVDGADVASIDLRPD